MCTSGSCCTSTPRAVESAVRLVDQSADAWPFALGSSSVRTWYVARTDAAEAACKWTRPGGTARNWARASATPSSVA